MRQNLRFKDKLIVFPIYDSKVVLENSYCIAPLEVTQQGNCNQQEYISAELEKTSGLIIPKESLFPLPKPSGNQVWVGLVSSITGSDKALKAYELKDAILLAKKQKEIILVEILECLLPLKFLANYSYSFSFHPKCIVKNVPVTQVFTFLKKDKNSYCVVRDEGDIAYSLPGGACELYEMPLDCLQRELLEETQLQGKNIKLLGSVLVDYKKNGKLICKYQHLRYSADVRELVPYTPRKNNFETVERKFVSLDFLKQHATQLQNSNADAILGQL